MKATLSGVFSDLSGAAGGIVVQQSYGGLQVHLKGQPKVKPTPARQKAKNSFKSVQSSWRALTNEERETWNAAAGTEQSGFQLYSSTNLKMVNGGLPMVNSYSPPAPNPMDQNITWYGGLLLNGFDPPYFLYSKSIPLFRTPRSPWKPYFLWTGWIPESQYRFPPIRYRIPNEAIGMDFIQWIVTFKNMPNYPAYPNSQYVKAKMTEAYINTQTGQIYTVGTTEFTATNFTTQYYPYHPNINFASGVFQVVGGSKYYTQEIVSGNNSFDFEIWKPWFWVNEWVGPPYITTDPLINLIPETAFEFIDSSHIKIHFGPDPGMAPMPPFEGARITMNIGWQNVASEEVEAEGNGELTASNH